MMLSDKYRPATWADVVGQEKAVAVFQRLAQTGGLLGRAFWLAGPSGSGKTTLARLASAEIADSINVTELDAGDCSVAALRDIEATYRYFPMGAKPGRAVIINEAHGLRKDSIRRLLVMLDSIPRHFAWFFTTTSQGAESLFEDQIDAGPLLSRCIPIPMAKQGIAQAFAARAKAVALAEGLDGRPLAQYVRLIQDCRNNLRMALSRIEAGEMLA